VKIIVWPADTQGCGRYRLIWPAEQVKAQGLDVTIIEPNERHNMFSGVVENGNVTDVRIPDADVMIFQRVTHKYLAQAIPLIRDRGVACVVDMDDDLECIHPKNPAWAMLHPKSWGNELIASHSWEWARYACQHATVVTTSSDALRERYAAHGRGVVLRNCVPESFLRIKHVDSNVVGWGGSIHSHPDDVLELGTAIMRLVNEGMPFHVVGPSTGLRDAFRLREEPTHSGNVQIDDWPSELARLGVGIAPLADSRFNAAKSWLKPLEYASVGVPCVMSNRREYREIAKHGIGTLVEKHKEWYTQLKKLATDTDYRVLRSEIAREAASKLTYELNGWRWAEVWADALTQQRKRSSSVFSKA